MAKKGLSNFVHAIFNEQAGTYGSPATTSGAIELKLDLQKNDAPIYSDNRLKYKDQSFKDGKIDLVVDFADQSILAPLMGKTTTAVSFSNGGATVTSSKITSKMSDIPEALGFSWIVKELDPNTKAEKFIVKTLPHVEFAGQTEDAKTQEGSVTFIYTTLSGVVYALADGTYYEEAIFNSQSDAVAYINTLYLATCADVVVSLASGTYTTAQAAGVTLACATVGSAIKYTLNGTTPSATNGTAYTVPINITATSGLKVIATKSGLANSPTVSREYIITA